VKLLHYKEIEKIVNEIMPDECGITKVEPEGLNVVIYLKNIKEFYKNDQLIKQLAGSLRKKVSVRVDSSGLMDVDDAKKKIKKIVSDDAKISNIMFSPEFSEVHIEALKPGLVIGKRGDYAYYWLVPSHTQNPYHSIIYTNRSEKICCYGWRRQKKILGVRRKKDMSKYTSK